MQVPKNKLWPNQAYFKPKNKATCWCFMTGLHAPSPLSILTFGGKRATRDTSGILLDDMVHVSFETTAPDSLLKLRETFVALLSAFLEGHSHLDNEVFQFRRMLAHNGGTVECHFKHQ